MYLTVIVLLIHKYNTILTNIRNYLKAIDKKEEKCNSEIIIIILLCTCVLVEADLIHQVG